MRRRRNKTFDQWTADVTLRMHKLFTRMYGDRDVERNKYIVILDVSQYDIPETCLQDNSISKRELYDVVLPKLHEKEIYAVYLDNLNIVMKEIIEKSPDKYAIRTTAKQVGISIEDLMLEFVYNLLSVEVDITGVVERQGFTVTD